MKLFSEYINEKAGALAVGDIIWINLSEEDVKIKHKIIENNFFK